MHSQPRVKKIILLIGLLLGSAPSIADDLWKCTDKNSDSVLFTNQPIKGRECRLLSKAFSKEEIALFRKNLKLGDMSNKGLVIEVKRPLAKVQEKDTERWHRISDLSPTIE